MRALLRRFASAAVAVAFLFALTGDALATHPCPHHFGAAAAAAVSHGSGHAGAHAADPAPGDEPHGPCTCMGRCHAGAAPPLVGPLLLGSVPVPAALPSPDAAPESADRPAIAPFSLPWANAPPTL